MKQVAGMMLAVASLATAWNPVRSGALVKKLGDMIIVNQSVRVLLKFDNTSIVPENVRHINHGIQIVKDKLIQYEHLNI